MMQLLTYSLALLLANFVRRTLHCFVALVTMAREMLGGGEAVDDGVQVPTAGETGGSVVTQFADLNDDCHMEILKYLRIGERFRLGQVSQRLQNVAQLVTDRFDEDDMPPRLHPRVEKNVYYFVQKVSERLRTMDFQWTCGDELASAIINGETTIQARVEQLVRICPKPIELFIDVMPEVRAYE